MPFKVHAIEIKDFSLLKLSAPINRCKRWEPSSFSSIVGSRSNDHWPVFLAHRVKVIDRFAVTGEKLFLGFVYFLLFAFYDLLNLSLIHISEPTRLLSISYAVF